LSTCHSVNNGLVESANNPEEATRERGNHWTTEETHLDGVVNNEIDGDTRVDAVGVTTEATSGVTHSGKVHDARHSGEVL
jgi:hypothetical protein